MNNQQKEDPDQPGPTNGNREFSAAMERLEKAVSEIVTVATGQLSDRATTLLDDTSRRLEAELRLRRVAEEVAEDREEIERRQQRHDRRRQYRHRLVDRAERVNPRSGRLYRDPENQRIGGVCAGLARYLGFETWAVRLAAVTGLIFLPGVVLPAYLIAYFIMDTPDQDLDEPSSGKRKRGKRRRRERDAGMQRGTAPVGNEPPRKFNARHSLRYAGADLTQAELRLRRIESFITSDQYELQKELAKIERDDHLQKQQQASGQAGADWNHGEPQRGY